MSRGRMLFKLGVILLVAASGILLFMAPVRVSGPGEAVSNPMTLPVILIGLASLLVAAGMARMILARRGYVQQMSSPRKRKHEDEAGAYGAFDDLADPIDLDGGGTLPLAGDDLPELSEDDLFLEDKPKRAG